MSGHWFPPHSPCFTAHLFCVVGAQHGGIAGLGDCSVLCFMFGRIIFLKLYVCNSHDGLESPMLHTKFRGNRPVGFGDKIFKRFLPYMGMAAILVM